MLAVCLGLGCNHYSMARLVSEGELIGEVAYKLALPLVLS